MRWGVKRGMPVCRGRSGSEVEESRAFLTRSARGEAQTGAKKCGLGIENDRVLRRDIKPKAQAFNRNSRGIV